MKIYKAKVFNERGNKVATVVLKSGKILKVKILNDRIEVEEYDAVTSHQQECLNGQK